MTPDQALIVDQLRLLLPDLDGREQCTVRGIINTIARMEMPIRTLHEAEATADQSYILPYLRFRATTCESVGDHYTAAILRSEAATIERMELPVRASSYLGAGDTEPPCPPSGTMIVKPRYSLRCTWRNGKKFQCSGALKALSEIAEMWTASGGTWTIETVP